MGREKGNIDFQMIIRKGTSLLDSIPYYSRIKLSRVHIDRVEGRNYEELCNHHENDNGDLVF